MNICHNKCIYKRVVLFILVIYNLTPKKAFFTDKTFKNIGEYPNKNWDLSLIYEMFNKKLSQAMIVKNTVNKNLVKYRQKLVICFCSYLSKKFGPTPDWVQICPQKYFLHICKYFIKRDMLTEVFLHICKLIVYE